MNSVRLYDSTVYRGGITSTSLSYGTSEIDVTLEKTLDIAFQLPSKGGGTTSICVAIDDSDICELLELISENRPDLAPELSKAAYKATCKALGIKIDQ